MHHSEIPAWGKWDGLLKGGLLVLSQKCSGKFPGHVYSDMKELELKGMNPFCFGKAGGCVGESSLQIFWNKSFALHPYRLSFAYSFLAHILSLQNTYFIGKDLVRLA